MRAPLPLALVLALAGLTPAEAKKKKLKKPQPTAQERHRIRRLMVRLLRARHEAKRAEAATKLAKRDLFYGSYPITPASDILHQLSTYKHFGVRTFQAEDEIAAIGSAIGAAFGGALALTASSRWMSRLSAV